MDLLIKYALSFVGTPYKWGGDDPMKGYDCSGFVQELLASCGMDPIGDQSAQALYDHFYENGRWNEHGPGALVFYGKDAKHITHVDMMVDVHRVIGAMSGGSATINEEAAAAHNAYIKIRHKSYRKDVVAVIRPRYELIGVI